jgi:signal transduction histidine kinase
VEGTPRPLATSTDLSLYRIVQEAVTNALRHARNATLVEVAVDGGPSSIRVSVRDDGEPGQGRATESGFGIIGMVERATLLGGACSAGPDRDRGWLVEATLPREVPR